MNVNKRKPQYVFAVKKNGKVYRYMARITKEYRQIYLGCFKTQKEAVAAVKYYLETGRKRGKN